MEKTIYTPPADAVRLLKLPEVLTTGSDRDFFDPFALWRLPKVLSVYPVSRAQWFAGVKAGQYPASVKISTKCVAWRSGDIRELISKL